MMPIEWDPPLSLRHGSPKRLGGLEVYYDFDWHSIFLHNRAVFPNGQSLANLAKRDCPTGKKPALLLTARDDVNPRIAETSDRYIMVVPIREYLREAGGDAASTYYARLSATPLTQLTALSQIAFSRAELDSFLDEHLTIHVLSSWAATSPARAQVLAETAAAKDSSNFESILEAVRALNVLDPRLLEAVIGRIEREGSGIGMDELMARVAQSEAGRLAASEALASNLSAKIADTRKQVEQYQDLIADPAMTETDVQQFLEVYPWIVGLHYARARPRVEIPRGVLDFVLERYDGFFDIVELKGPDAIIVSERLSGASTDRPSSGSACSLGPAVSNALAQAHLYRSILQESQGLEGQYGLKDTRQPRILILVGRSSDLSSNGALVLRELNLSLHRVEVIPYDLLGQRMAGLLDNVEALLSGADS